MKIRDRIKGLRRVKASELTPHPKNWRTHPEKQKNAMRGVLADIGIADALIVRELKDKTLQILDGHLRAETTPDQKVPVLVVDLNDQEALKLLATHDPLAEMAEADPQILLDLVKGIETENDDVAGMLNSLVADHGTKGKGKGKKKKDDESKDARPQYGILVDCKDEAEQTGLLERFTKEGLNCRSVTGTCTVNYWK